MPRLSQTAARPSGANYRPRHKSRRKVYGHPYRIQAPSNHFFSKFILEFQVNKAPKTPSVTGFDSPFSVTIPVIRRAGVTSNAGV